MNAEFFVLAFAAALNPKLLGVDLLLIENRRPRAMFLCVLLGGLTVGVTVGLLDVLVFQVDAISSQNGHDTFLIDYDLITPPVKAFLTLRG